MIPSYRSAGDGLLPLATFVGAIGGLHLPAGAAVRENRGDPWDIDIPKSELKVLSEISYGTHGMILWSTICSSLGNLIEILDIYSTWLTILMVKNLSLVAKHPPL